MTTAYQIHMKLTGNEVDLVGDWILADGKIEVDKICQRIEWLIQNHLNRLAVADGGWSSLYQDPDDKRFWEKVYPRSEMHGGGPPHLRVITFEEARKKYQF